jgi:hypothetical protein
MSSFLFAALSLVALPFIGGSRTESPSPSSPGDATGQVAPAARITQQPLVVTGAKVVFFSPVQNERDSIVRTEGMESARLFDDFDYYSGKVSAYLKRRGVGVIMTSAPVIVVQFGEKSTRTIERNKLTDFLGVVLTDGVQEPKLFLGVASDEELIPECSQYFRLK